ncbi:hypothetical protein [Isoptericola aurantiacus]|uniref:hypothetical protein n=1 Tax=Isoptericola aurantiacus TaxID=3377839 RepID=UPI00383B97A8
MHPLEAMTVYQALHEERLADAERARLVRRVRAANAAGTHPAQHLDPRHGWWGDVVALLRARTPVPRHPQPQHGWTPRPRPAEHRTRTARTVG